MILGQPPSLTQDEDTVASHNVRANDTDLGGNGSYHVDSASVVFGNVSVEASGNNVIVSPTVENWYGDYKFEYTLINEYNEISIAVATGKLLPVNDAPIIASDSATVQESGFVSINVRANDSDVDHPGTSVWLTPEIVNYPQHGLAWISADMVLYTPNANYNGPDSLEYIIKDENGWYSTNTATVEITVTPKNVKPRANGAGIETDEDTPLALSLQGDGGDGDEYANQVLTFAITTAPTHGNIDPDTLIYTPDPNDPGPSDYFEFTVTDDGLAGPTASLTSDPAGVTITINPINDAPTASGSSGSCDEDAPATINVSAKYGDVDDAWATLVVTTDSLLPPCRAG